MKLRTHPVPLYMCLLKIVTCRGQVPARAEYQYLDRVKWLDMYGVDLYPVQVTNLLFILIYMIYMWKIVDVVYLVPSAICLLKDQ